MVKIEFEFVTNKKIVDAIKQKVSTIKKSRNILIDWLATYKNESFAPDLAADKKPAMKKNTGISQKER